VIDLYERAKVGASVVVLRGSMSAELGPTPLGPTPAGLY